MGISGNNTQLEYSALKKIYKKCIEQDANKFIKGLFCINEASHFSLCCPTCKNWVNYVYREGGEE